MNRDGRAQSRREDGIVAAPATETTASTRQRRVLIVEDESIVQLHLRRILEALGYAVAGIAETADQALAQAAASRPDAVLMDVQLPGRRDGVDAARELRALYDVPIVFVTAYADAQTVARAQAVGPAAYVVKPFTQVDIQSALAAALERT